MDREDEGRGRSSTVVDALGQPTTTTATMRQTTMRQNYDEAYQGKSNQIKASYDEAN